MIETLNVLLHETARLQKGGEKLPFFFQLLDWFCQLRVKIEHTVEREWREKEGWAGEGVEALMS